MSAETFGQRFAEVLATISDPEKTLGVSRATIRRLLRGAHDPSAEVLRTLVGLGWSGSWLLSGQGDRMSPAPVSMTDWNRQDLQDALHDGNVVVLGKVIRRAEAIAEVAGQPVAPEHVAAAWKTLGGDA